MTVEKVRRVNSSKYIINVYNLKIKYTSIYVWNKRPTKKRQKKKKTSTKIRIFQEVIKLLFIIDYKGNLTIW